MSKLLLEGDEEQFDNEFQIEEYELTSTPNDFNILTINSFIESGAILIPGFQRNYVWDIKRASKLIESIILGLPVPQIFLYEEKRNSFLVIDGQQRLMTLFYFIKQRFPKKEKRTQIRKLFAEHGTIPETILFSDDYFSQFKLSLPSKSKERKNKFNGLSYKTLNDYKSQFDLRPIRNVVVKQNVPKDDHSAIFEIFNRLNSGGINLMAQEIRCSLYHSKFYDILYRLNLNPNWRRILKLEDPDLHMKDIELLVRGFSMMTYGDNYTSSLAKFLNTYSAIAKKYDESTLIYLEEVFIKVLECCSELPDDTFINKKTKRFNTFLFEGLMYFIGQKHFEKKTFPTKKISYEEIDALESDEVFANASIHGTTNKDSVEKRLSRAKLILK
ncbi:MAG: DUF262 domain-containing protein [Bacteroidia bacterium]